MASCASCIYKHTFTLRKTKQQKDGDLSSYSVPHSVLSVILLKEWLTCFEGHPRFVDLRETMTKNVCGDSVQEMLPSIVLVLVVFRIFVGEIKNVFVFCFFFYIKPLFSYLLKRNNGCVIYRQCLCGKRTEQIGWKKPGTLAYGIHRFYIYLQINSRTRFGHDADEGI